MSDTNFTPGTVITSDWLNDVNDAVYDGAVSVVASGTGAVERTVQDKVRDHVSVGDYTNATVAITAVDTAGDGTVTVPNMVVAVLPASFPQAVIEYLSQTGWSVYQDSGEANRIARRLLRTQDAGTHPLDQVSVLGIEHRPVGSGVNGPAFADIGQTISVIKKDWLTTSAQGEIDGLNVVVRQGGAASSDCAAILGDVAVKTGVGFAAFTEGAVRTVNSSGVTQRALSVQSGVLDDVGGGSFGYAAVATTGTTADAFLANSTGGTGSFTSFLRYITSAGVEAFRVNASGQIILTATSGATPKKTIRSNAGGLSVVNDAGSTQIFFLSDAGALSVTGGIGAVGDISGQGNIIANLLGKGMRVTEGANAKQGASTLVGGTVTVANTTVTASSRILVTSNVDGGTPGWLRVSARVVGTSFTITSSSGTDTSTVAWQIFEPA